MSPKSAQDHHAAAGEAFANGDAKGAAKHMGHALRAMRKAKSPIDGETSAPAPEHHATDAGTSKIRQRLKRIGASSTEK